MIGVLDSEERETRPEGADSSAFRSLTSANRERKLAGITGGGFITHLNFYPQRGFFFVVQCKKVKRCTNRAGIVAVVSEKRRGLRQVRACTGSDGKPGIARHSHVVHEHRHKHQENAGLLSSDSCVSKTPLLNTRPHAEPQEGLRFCY